MGEVIPMRRPQGSVRRETIPGQSAEILFFMGVRYVRMPETDPALASVTPRRRSTKSNRVSKNTDVKRA